VEGVQPGGAKHQQAFGHWRRNAWALHCPVALEPWEKGARPGPKLAPRPPAREITSPISGPVDTCYLEGVLSARQQLPGLLVLPRRLAVLRGSLGAGSWELSSLPCTVTLVSPDCHPARPRNPNLRPSTAPLPIVADVGVGHSCVDWPSSGPSDCSTFGSALSYRRSYSPFHEGSLRNSCLISRNLGGRRKGESSHWPNE
jgi:hypothetical protein